MTDELKDLQDQIVEEEFRERLLDEAVQELRGLSIATHPYHCSSGHTFELPGETYTLLAISIGGQTININSCPLCFGEWLKGVLVDARVPELLRTDDPSSS